MKGVLMKSLDWQYAVQLMNIEQFTEQWTRVEEIVLGEQTTNKVRLTEEIYSLKWHGNLEDLLERFLSTVQEYKSVGGSCLTQNSPTVF